MQTSSFFAVIPSPSQSSSDLKSTFERLKAVDEGERSIKFLLKNEFLHRFELLNSSRSIVSRSIPSTTSPQVEMPHAPASTEEPTPSKSHVETALKKCTGPSEDVGPSDKVPLSPIVEEETAPQRPGKDHAESDKWTEEEQAHIYGALDEVGMWTGLAKRWLKRTLCIKERQEIDSEDFIYQTWRSGLHK